MKIGDAIASLGIVQQDGDIVVVRIKDGTAENYRLAEVHEREINGDLYLKTGTFATGTVSRHKGASKENLLRINELPFDFDLVDFTGIPKADLWEMPDEALWPLIEAQQEAVEHTFAAIGLTLHRIDYTGYGLAGYLRLPLHKPDAIPAIQALHKRIIERVNAIARINLCDPAVSDAGTRFMRIPGCHNTKGAITRLSRTLVQREGMVNEAQLTTAAGATSTAQARIIPATGTGLDQATIDQLLESVGPHWTPGNRHHLALAIAGMLAKANVPEEQTQAIVTQLCWDAGGDANDTGKAVHTSYERVRAGSPVKGFYGLQEQLPVALVQWLDGIAQRAYQASSPKLVAGGGEYKSEHKEPPRAKRAEFEDVPTEVLTGWVGEYCALVGPTTEASASFHVGVSLTMAGALFGRHVFAQYGEDPLFANLYTLLVGRSAKTRKDTSIKRATRILFDHSTHGTKVVNHGIGIATDVGSSTKLIDMLARNPNTLLYMTEFTRLMGNARRQSTDTIIPTLMEAWDAPPRMQNNSMANPIEAQFPYLSILAATQPDILAETMSGSDMNSGFANRWLFVCGNLGTPNPLPPMLDRVRMSALIHDLWGAKHSYAQGYGLVLDSDARARWNDWYITDFALESTSFEEDAMRARHAVLIWKVALIYAVGQGSKTITLDHLNVGISLVEWMWRQLKRLLPAWGRSIDGQIEERIKTILTDFGPMKRREIQMRCNTRKFSGVDFGRVFESMVKNQIITVDPFGLASLNED